MTRRNTSQQAAIWNAIQDEGRPLSIPEIHQIAATMSPGVGLRTVYRVVNRLVTDELISPVSLNGQPVRYELAEIAGQHHHHFHCSGCDRVYDLHGCPGHLEEMLPEGFELTGHEITLNGLCKDCA